jgi:WD40 repeat protein
MSNRSSSTPQPDVFVVGGPVQAVGGVYLERPADQELLGLCLKNEYVYILTPRQMGKSSLMFNTCDRLAEQGIKTAVVDLTEIGGSVDASQWYLGILSAIESRLELTTDLYTWWERHQQLGPAQRFSQFFEQVLLVDNQNRIVIFLDEIDTTLSAGVRSFSDDFFAAIRALYTARARNPELKRLSFVLIGVATPNELINDPKRTPFNIGRSVDLSDFTFQEAQPFMSGFGLSARDGEMVLRQVLQWTGGHPYLTQRLCRLIAEAGRTSWAEQDIANLVKETFFGDQSSKDNNLAFVRNMLTERAPDRDLVLSTYRDIRRGDRVPDEERSIIKSHLKLSGVVRSNQGMLQIRNPIYETVFDQHFIDQYLSEDSARRELQAANERAEEEKRKRKEAQQANRRLQTRLWFSRIGTGVAVLGVIAAVVYAVQANNRAQVAQIDSAATTAISKIEDRYDQALLVANAANRFNDNATTKDALLRTVQASSSNLTSVLMGHTNNVSSVAFSPDGKLLASASYDTTIRFWDVKTRKAKGEPLKGHTDTIWKVVFSPDGKLLASASFDKTIRLWDVSSRKEIAKLEGHTKAVRGVAFNPDGKLLASASEDKTVRLWDVSSRKEITKPVGHKDGVFSVAFSPDGNTLASGGRDQTIRLWNISSQQQINASLQGYVGIVSSVASSPNGKPEYAGIVSSVAFSPDGKLLASGSYDKRVRLWNWRDPKAKPVILKGHTGDVDSVVFSPDGKTLASSGMDKTIRLWDVARHTVREPPLEGHAGIVLSVAFSPDGKMLASGSFDKSIRLWDTSSNRKIQELKGHYGAVSDVTFNPNGKTLASASDDRTVRVWNTSDGQGSLLFKSDTSSMESIAFSPDGKTLAFASDDGTIWLRNTNGKQVTRLKGHTRSVYSVAFSPDGKSLASASRDQTVRLWNTSDGQIIRVLKGHTDIVSSVRFSPDGKTLVSVSWDRTIRLWNTSNGQIIRVLNGHTDYVISVAFSPNGKTLASAGFDKTIRLWNMSDGQIIRTLEGHVGAVSRVTFSSDGKTLASASVDRTIRLWNTNRGQIIGILEGHTNYIYSLVFSPDDKTLASGSVDNTIRLWDISSESQMAQYSLKGWRARACSIAGRNLTQAEWREFFGNLSYQTSCPDFPPGQ